MEVTAKVIPTPLKTEVKEGEGNATLRTYLIDALFNMTDEELEKSGKYEVQ